MRPKSFWEIGAIGAILLGVMGLFCAVIIAIAKEFGAQ